MGLPLMGRLLHLDQGLLSCRRQTQPIREVAPDFPLFIHRDDVGL